MAMHARTENLEIKPITEDIVYNHVDCRYWIEIAYMVYSEYRMLKLEL